MNVPALASGHDLVSLAAKKFDRVARTCADRLHVQDIELAGARVQLRLVGDGLAAALLETFAHLCESPSPAQSDLRIDAWAEDETGETALPNEPPADVRQMIAIDGGTLALSVDEEHLVNLTGGNCVAWLDRRARRIVASVRRADELLLRERVKPFGTLITFWLRDRGVRVLHAAAVGDGERAVLLPGLSGAGKSTCALLGLDAGLRYLGDDTVGMREKSDGAFEVHSLYGAARLWPDDARTFPGWSARAIQPDSAGDEPKLLLFVGRRHAQQLTRRSTIAAVAFPQIVDRTDTRVRRMTRPEAMRTLVRTSLFLGMRPEPGDVEQMLRLITTTPTFALELGTDRSQIPARIEECLGAGNGAG